MKGYRFDIVKNKNNIHTEFVINYKDNEIIDITERRRNGTQDALTIWGFKDGTVKTRMQKGEVFKQYTLDEAEKDRILGVVIGDIK
jgi:hypothetical protein